MAKSDYIPSRDTEFLLWHDNLETIGAGLAKDNTTVHKSPPRSWKPEPHRPSTHKRQLRKQRGDSESHLFVPFVSFC